MQDYLRPGYVIASMSTVKLFGDDLCSHSAQLGEDVCFVIYFWISCAHYQGNTTVAKKDVISVSSQLFFSCAFFKMCLYPGRRKRRRKRLYQTMKRWNRGNQAP